MSLISLLVFLCIVGVILYLVSVVPIMPAWMKTVINCVAAIGVLLFLLQAFGLYSVPFRLR